MRFSTHAVIAAVLACGLALSAGTAQASNAPISPLVGSSAPLSSALVVDHHWENMDDDDEWPPKRPRCHRDADGTVHCKPYYQYDYDDEHDFDWDWENPAPRPKPQPKPEPCCPKPPEPDCCTPPLVAAASK